MADVVGTVATVFDIANRLYNIISDLAGAHDELRSANESLERTVACLKEVQAFLQGSEGGVALNAGSALKSALQSCQKTCQQFETKLSKCASHSESGKLSLRDRITTVWSKRDIAKFNEDLGMERQVILIAISSHTMQTTTQTAESLMNFQSDVENTIKSLSAKIQDLTTAINYIDEDSPQMKEFQNQITMLREQLSYCNQSLTNVQKGFHSIQRFGSRVFEDSSHNVQGIDLTSVQGNIAQEFGDATFRRSQLNFQGAFGAETYAALIRSAAQLPNPTAQAEKPRGEGRRLGGDNVYTLASMPTEKRS